MKSSLEISKGWIRLNIASSRLSHFPLSKKWTCNRTILGTNKPLVKAFSSPLADKKSLVESPWSFALIQVVLTYLRVSKFCRRRRTEMTFVDPWGAWPPAWPHLWPLNHFIFRTVFAVAGALSTAGGHQEKGQNQAQSCLHAAAGTSAICSRSRKLSGLSSLAATPLRPAPR